MLTEFDIALKTLSNKKSGTGRTYPPEPAEKNSEELTAEEREESICSADASKSRWRSSGSSSLQGPSHWSAKIQKSESILIEAGEEETDHLVWCKKRLKRARWEAVLSLNPIWYAGSFAIGAIFGSLGEKVSLGFVEETEKQVVAHIDRHLDKISPKDKETIEILRTMKEDEDLHAQQAVDKGGEELNIPVKQIMKYTAKMMTSTSKYV